MRITLSRAVWLVPGSLSLAGVLALQASCKKQDDTTQAAAAPSAYPPGQYPQQGYPPGQYPQQGQYPQGQYPLQCTNDVPCGTHHCNTQYGRCAFPCQSAVDCITPNTCMMGLCVPAPPGQTH